MKDLLEGMPTNTRERVLCCDQGEKASDSTHQAAGVTTDQYSNFTVVNPRMHGGTEKSALRTEKVSGEPDG